MPNNPRRNPRRPVVWHTLTAGYISRLRPSTELTQRARRRAAQVQEEGQTKDIVSDRILRHHQCSTLLQVNIYPDGRKNLSCRIRASWDTGPRVLGTLEELPVEAARGCALTLYLAYITMGEEFTQGVFDTIVSYYRKATHTRPTVRRPLASYPVGPMVRKVLANDARRGNFNNGFYHLNTDMLHGVQWCQALLVQPCHSDVVITPHPKG